MTSFVRAGHRYNLYTYGQLADVPAGVTLCDAGEILPQDAIFRNQLGKGKGSFACFSDLFRYKLLYERGGWWVDTDVFCLRAFDFAAPYVFGAEDKPVATGVIKVPPRSELARRCYEQAQAVDHAQVVWNELCEIFANGVRDLDLMGHVLPAEVFSPIAWHEVPQFVRGRKHFKPPAASHGVHLYNEMWRRNKLDKRALYPPTSVIEVLKRQAGFAGQSFGAKPPTSIARRWLSHWFRRPAAA